MSDELKLKPCPFCRGEAFVHMLGNEIAKGYYIACDECGAKTIVFGYEAESIEAWNRRSERTAKVETYTDDQQETWSVCECGTDVWKSYNYCPECGAKLDWSE